MATSETQKWIKTYRGMGLPYPAEYVIRIFKGSYPNLTLDRDSFKGKKICEIGCGTGRNLVVLGECGFKLYGCDIAQEIIDKTSKNLRKTGLKTDLRVGTNRKLPFKDVFLDYLLSWNSCYYMGENRDFGEYVSEFARILKPHGQLILSIPKKSCFIFKNSRRRKGGLRIITNDPLKSRNGAVLKMFRDENEIRDTFSPCFSDFTFGSVHDNCFGRNYHWHLVVCRRT